MEDSASDDASNPLGVDLSTVGQARYEGFVASLTEGQTGMCDMACDAV